MRLAGVHVAAARVARRHAGAGLVPARRREFAGRGRVALRRHWLFAVVAGCAAGLRVVVQLAYQPALIFPDSVRYLQYAHNFVTGSWSPDWLRTSGYSLLLIPAVLTHNLASVAAVQHLLGLATATLVYAVLVHFGAQALAGRAGDRPGPVRPPPARHRAVRPDRHQRDVPARRGAGRAGVEARCDRPGGARRGRAAARRRHDHQGIQPDRAHPRRALPGSRLPAQAPRGRQDGGAAAPGLPAPGARLPRLGRRVVRALRLRQLRQPVPVRADRAVHRLHPPDAAVLRAVAVPAAAAGAARPELLHVGPAVAAGGLPGAARPEQGPHHAGLRPAGHRAPAAGLPGGGGRRRPLQLLPGARGRDPSTTRSCTTSSRRSSPATRTCLAA